MSKFKLKNPTLVLTRKKRKYLENVLQDMSEFSREKLRGELKLYVSFKAPGPVWVNRRRLAVLHCLGIKVLRTLQEKRRQEHADAPVWLSKKLLEKMPQNGGYKPGELVIDFAPMAPEGKSRLIPVLMKAGYYNTAAALQKGRPLVEPFEISVARKDKSEGAHPLSFGNFPRRPELVSTMSIARGSANGDAVSDTVIKNADGKGDVTVFYSDPWERLHDEMHEMLAKLPRPDLGSSKPMMATMPLHEPARVLDGTTPGIYPVRGEYHLTKPPEGPAVRIAFLEPGFDEEKFFAGCEKGVMHGMVGINKPGLTNQDFPATGQDADDLLQSMMGTTMLHEPGVARGIHPSLLTAEQIDSKIFFDLQSASSDLHSAIRKAWQAVPDESASGQKVFSGFNSLMNPENLPVVISDSPNTDYR